MKIVGTGLSYFAAGILFDRRLILTLTDLIESVDLMFHEVKTTTRTRRQTFSTSE